ncbi:hypothetical protein C8P68_106307 [Mucilaginibacter yixingensis]|uniref:Secretion system C-terminal sorting domain-containing protein n=2 Tax=Mucilaginibacter yixingensis TaxID=1295612 RepID=A0A2T5J7G5_9SPHI|nr:hypothetical protein C8P68_106307 [Mucilaginibacter yixingensis]
MTWLVLLCGKASAATYTWTGLGTNSNWSNTSNWTGGTYPHLSTDNVTIPLTGTFKSPTVDVAVICGTLTISGSVTVNLSANLTASGAVTISNGVTAVINAASSTTFQISSGISVGSSSTTSITFSGNGATNLSGTFTASQNVTFAVSTGHTFSFNAGASYSGGNSTTVNNGGTLNINGTSSTGCTFTPGFQSSFTNTGTFAGTYVNWTEASNTVTMSNSGTFGLSNSTFSQTQSSTFTNTSNTSTFTTCTISLPNNNSYITASAGTVNLTGCTISLTGNPSYLSNSSTGNLHIYGSSSLAITGPNKPYISGAGTGSFTIDGGSSISVTNFGPQIKNSGKMYFGTSGSSCTVTLNSQPQDQSTGATVYNTGTMYLGSTSIIKFGNQYQTTVNNVGTFTLQSDANGSAAIGDMSGSSTNAIIGTYNVERYLAGQSSGTTADSKRNYRLISSPVSTTGLSGGVYTLSYLNTNSGGVTGIFTSGPSGGGFTYSPASGTANSTVYLYQETVASSNTSFNSGNFKGITKLDNGSNQVLYNDGSTSANAASLYAGNGFMVYYVGNNVSNTGTSTSTPTKASRVGGSYAAVDNSTMSASGKLNTGQIVTKMWFNSSNPSRSAVGTGYNLVGNPYPSTIDWDTFNTTTSTTGVYGPNLTGVIAVFDYASKNYGFYIPAALGTVSPTNNASHLIMSGQGFFVQVKSGQTSSTLTFNESCKSTSSPNFSNSPLMGVPVGQKVTQYVKLRVAKDSINRDEAIVMFDGKNQYEDSFDVYRLAGNGNIATLGTYPQGNSTLLAINHMQSIDSTTRVKIYANVISSTGIDTISAYGIETLDSRYDAFLIDHYKKDSLQISLYKRYNFNITSDTASYGTNRFELAFHKKPGLNYHLLSFTGMQVKDGIQLTWRVENEQNLTTFSVQKADGTQQFISIYGMQSDGRGTYTWLDKAPSTGVNTYRLQQNDPFENISYSKPITVNFDNSTSSGDALTVYPNPTISDLNVKLNNSSIPNQVLVKVFDSSGQLKLNKVTDGNHIQENIGNLLPGVYVVQILDNATQTLVGQKKITKAK